MRYPRASAMALAFAVLPLSASADTPPFKSADSMAVSPGGVDLRTGHYIVDVEDLSIGSGSVGAIVFKRVLGLDHAMGSGGYGLGEFRPNWHFPLQQNRTCSQCAGVSTISVAAEGVSYTFSDSGNNVLRQTSNNSFAQLSRTMVGTDQNYYSLTTASGTVMVFQTIPYPSSSAIGPTTWIALPISINHADGVGYWFTYGSSFTSVTSNAGYRLIMELATNSQVKRACVVNLAKSNASTTCPAGVQTANYGYTGNWLTAFTDRRGQTWTSTTNFTAFNSPFTEQIFQPGEASPYLVNHWDTANGDNDVVTSQDFADGRHVTYSYDPETYFTAIQNGDQVDKNFNLGTGWIVNNTEQTKVTFGSNGQTPPTITPTPTQIIDPIGRIYQWTYPPVNQWQGGALITSRVRPDQDQESYTYDAYQNITRIEQSPKPGSPLAHIVTTAVFGNCSNAGLVACDKPTATVDGIGNETDITYNPVHGGVLTETLPAGANGIRPVRRYTYAQRYAWISDGSGGWGHAGGPIWVKTEMRTCRTTSTTGNTCAGGSADEEVTVYDYGPDSGPNNLWLRGVAVTTDGQTRRTCYGYDDYGQQIWETKPRANLATCS